MILLAVRYEIPATRVKLIKVWQVIRHRSAQVWNKRGNTWAETVKREITSKCKQTEMHQQHPGMRCDTNSLENQVRKKLCSFLQIDEPPSIFCLWRNDPFWASRTHAQLLYYFVILLFCCRKTCWCEECSLSVPQPLQPLSACPNSSEKCCWHKIQYKKKIYLYSKKKRKEDNINIKCVVLCTFT